MNDKLEAILDSRRGLPVHLKAIFDDGKDQPIYDLTNLNDITYDDLYTALEKNYRLEQIEVIRDLINDKLKEDKVNNSSANTNDRLQRSFDGIYFAMHFRDYYYAFAKGDGKAKKNSLAEIYKYLEPVFTGHLKAVIISEKQPAVVIPE